MAPELSSSMLTSSLRSYTEYEEAIEGAGCAKPKQFLPSYGHHHHHHHDPLNNSDRSDESANNFDLKRDYQNAIDCLINCEELITTLQKRLQTKDEQIATLEETIVQMSLQLANSKAFEDEFRSTKRRSSMESCNDNSLQLSDISDRDNDGSSDDSKDDVLLKNNKDRRTKTKERRHTSDGRIATSGTTNGGGGRGSGRSSSKGGGQRRAVRRQSMPLNTSDVEPLPAAPKSKSSRRKSLLDYHQSAPRMDDLPKPLPPPQPQTNQRRKWTRSLPMGDLWGLGSSMMGGGTDEEGDNLDVSCWDERDKDLDISTYSLPLLDRTEGSMSTNNTFGFGKMFNRSKSKDKLLLDASERGGGGGLDVSERLDTSHQKEDTTTTNQNQNSNRRAPNKARIERQFQGSSRSFLEGVVFPQSLEDVVVKGLELRDSLTKSNRSMMMDGSFRDG